MVDDLPRFEADHWLATQDIGCALVGINLSLAGSRGQDRRGPDSSRYSWRRKRNVRSDKAKLASGVHDVRYVGVLDESQQPNYYPL